MNSLEQPLASAENAPSPSPVRIPAKAEPRVHLFLWAVVLMILVGLAFVAGLLPRQRQRVALAIETKELAVPTVTVVSPTPAKAPATLALPAEIRPLTEAPIHARASGYLKRWLVDLGAKVEAGQLLAEIDTPELNQELAQSRAQLAQSQAALDLAKTTAARWAELLKTASVSEQEAAEKRADLALKSATVEAARANVRRLEELQSFDRVVAPFAGVITARRVDIGDLIKADNGTELFRLAETHKLRVFVRVPQGAAPRMLPGVTAELHIPELPGRDFTALVVRTAGMLSSDSRTLLTELEVDNSRGEILSGSYAQVSFPDDKPAASLTLPANTLLFHAEGTLVGVVRADNTVELRKVKLGRDFGPVIEISSGIEPNDRVIVNPFDSLVAGTTVRVAEPTAPNTK